MLIKTFWCNFFLLVPQFLIHRTINLPYSTWSIKIFQKIFIHNQQLVTTKFPSLGIKNGVFVLVWASLHHPPILSEKLPKKNFHWAAFLSSFTIIIIIIVVVVLVQHLQQNCLDLHKVVRDIRQLPKKQKFLPSSVHFLKC